MIFTRTQLRATFRRRSFDDDGSRRVRRQRWTTDQQRFREGRTL